MLCSASAPLAATAGDIVQPFKSFKLNPNASVFIGQRTAELCAFNAEAPISVPIAMTPKLNAKANIFVPRFCSQNSSQAAAATGTGPFLKYFKLNPAARSFEPRALHEDVNEHSENESGRRLAESYAKDGWEGREGTIDTTEQSLEGEKHICIQTPDFQEQQPDQAPDYACEEPECAADDVEYERQRGELAYYPDIHHFNWLGDGIMGRTATPPAVSLVVALTKPRARAIDMEMSLREHIITREAMMAIDPVVYWGDLNILQTFKGEALRNKVTGLVAKFYAGHGAWKSDEYDENDDRPFTDPVVTSNYSDIVVNGWFADRGVQTRKDYWNHANNASQDAERIQKEIHRDRRAKKIGKSPLYNAVFLEETQQKDLNHETATTLVYIEASFGPRERWSDEVGGKPLREMSKDKVKSALIDIDAMFGSCKTWADEVGEENDDDVEHEEETPVESFSVHTKDDASSLESAVRVPAIFDTATGHLVNTLSTGTNVLYAISEEEQVAEEETNISSNSDESENSSQDAKLSPSAASIAESYGEALVQAGKTSTVELLTRGSASLPVAPCSDLPSLLQEGENCTPMTSPHKAGGSPFKRPAANTPTAMRYKYLRPQRILDEISPEDDWSIDLPGWSSPLAESTPRGITYDTHQEASTFLDQMYEDDDEQDGEADSSEIWARDALAGLGAIFQHNSQLEVENRGSTTSEKAPIRPTSSPHKTTTPPVPAPACHSGEAAAKRSSKLRKLFKLGHSSSSSPEPKSPQRTSSSSSWLHVQQKLQKLQKKTMPVPPQSLTTAKIRRAPNQSVHFGKSLKKAFVKGLEMLSPLAVAPY